MDADEMGTLLAMLGRRRFVYALGAAVLSAGCTGAPSAADGGGPDADDPDGGDSALGSDGGTSDADVAPGENRAPIWREVPRQVWIVGVPVFLDLADYCRDPDGDDLSFSIDAALPAGVTREGSVISGTPESAFAEVTVVARADDGWSA